MISNCFNAGKRFIVTEINDFSALVVAPCKGKAKHDDIIGAILRQTGTFAMATSLICAGLNVRSFKLNPPSSILRLCVNTTFFVLGLDLFRRISSKSCKTLLLDRMLPAIARCIGTIFQDLDAIQNPEQRNYPYLSAYGYEMSNHKQSLLTQRLIACAATFFLAGATVYKASSLITNPSLATLSDPLLFLASTIFCDDMIKACTSDLKYDADKWKRVQEADKAITKETTQTAKEKFKVSFMIQEIEHAKKFEKVQYDDTIIFKGMDYLFSLFVKEEAQQDGK